MSINLSELSAQIKKNQTDGNKNSLSGSKWFDLTYIDSIHISPLYFIKYIHQKRNNRHNNFIYLQ